MLFYGLIIGRIWDLNSIVIPCSIYLLRKHKYWFLSLTLCWIQYPPKWEDRHKDTREMFSVIVAQLWFTWAWVVSFFRLEKLSTSKIHGVGVFKRGWVDGAGLSFGTCLPRMLSILERNGDFVLHWDGPQAGLKMGDPKSVHSCLPALVKSNLWLVLTKLSASWGCFPSLHPSTMHEPVNHTQKQFAELKFWKINNTSVPFLSRW